MAAENKNPEEDKTLPEEKTVKAEPVQAKKSTAARKTAVKKTPAKKAAPKKAAAEKKTSEGSSVKKEDIVEVAAKGAGNSEKKTEIPKQEKKANQPSSFDRGALILGGGLLLMGVISLMGRLLNIPFGDFLWPFIFIVPGVLVFLTALSTESSSGEGLSILGGILTMLGFVFLAQSVTGLWASWAYAWALVAPTSVGISQMVYGMRKDRDTIVQSGRKLANLGMTMFVIGFVFFELVIGINGFGLRRFGLPVFPLMLIFAGLVVLYSTLMRKK